MQEGQRKLRALGEAVRNERQRLDMSQEDFAERCDLHRTYIGQIERGEKNISFLNILKVANAIGAKPSELFRNAGM